MSLNDSTSPLSAWHEGSVKQAIFQFLDAVCDEHSVDFVPVKDRIAVFDHDGTLWVEKPLMAQLAFMKARLFDLQSLRSEPERLNLLHWLKETLDDVLAELIDDFAELAKDVFDGLSTQEYRQWVLTWMRQARHPRFHCHYSELAYLPMLQVLEQFKAHQFQCFIVTGGSSDFVRPWCEQVYQLPPRHILGSSLRTNLVERDAQLEIQYLPIPFVLENGEAKVTAIHRITGQQPIAAFGNSSGDVEMLRWTEQAKNALVCLVHHTDAQREYAYSPDGRLHIGKSTLAVARERNWQVIDMKNDWRQIFV